MLKLITGVFGSGKTYTIDTLIINALSQGKKAMLIVPEQEVIEAERRIADRAENEGVFCEDLTVVSFRRLADLAFREYGGIRYTELGDAGKTLILWRLTEELSPVLKAYNKCRDRSLIEKLLSVCNELNRYCISPAQLSSLSEKTPDLHLKDKLYDISIIYAAYSNIIKYEHPDATEDVNRLAQLLKENRFLENTELFLDSFNGFTVSELNCIEYALLQCNITVTLAYPDVRGKSGYLTIEKTYDSLIDIAKRHHIETDTSTHLQPLKKYIPAEFRIIEDKLFDFSYSPSANISSNRISLVKCADEFSQAEFVALRICELVRQGARYRDIAIINRNTESFNGILDAVFEKYSIPLFYSVRSKLTETAIYKSISSALDVITDRFRTQSVMTYIKCGLTKLSQRQIDLIESYTSMWGITGKRWIDEYDWNMNPSGFTDDLGTDSSDIIKEINEIRRTICAPLQKLGDSLKNVSLKEAAKAIYSFIFESSIMSCYESSTKAEDTTIYNTFIAMLDSCVLATPDIPVNPTVLSSIFYLCAKYTDFGRIPATFDRVTAGDASMLRVNGCKHIFLLDCENGVFPKAISDDSFFTDTEKKYMLENGLEISPDIIHQNDDEIFYFLRSACCATETLTASYTERDGNEFPSIAFSRLKTLFSKNQVLCYPDDFSQVDKINTIISSKDVIISLKNTDLYEVIEKLADELGQNLSYESGNITETDCNLSSDTSNALYGKNIRLTQSRIESYVKCPFLYHCSYSLKLNEKKHSFFQASDMGTYIHRILEKSAAIIFGKQYRDEEITDKIIASVTEQTTNEVLSVILGEAPKDDLRLDALILRLKKTITILIKNLVEEFKNSKFTPRFFEFSINENNGVPPLAVTTDEGTKISVSGIIDRVDTYEKDGKIYVRVVDYKTGSREHSLKNIYYGIDMQMLLYLFSICNSQNVALFSSDNESENNTEKTILPAGVLYQPSKLKITGTDHLPSDADAFKFAEAGLVRNGVILNDESIIDAMEKDLNGRFIPVTVKNGALKSSEGTLKTLAEFGQLMQDIEAVLKKIATKMKSGNACVEPMNNKIINACDYCKMKPVCRVKK